MSTQTSPGYLSTQTSSGFNEYTNLSSTQFIQVISVSISPWDKDHSNLKETLLKERTIKAHKGLLHNGEELHNGFA